MARADESFLDAIDRLDSAVARIDFESEQCAGGGDVVVGLIRGLDPKRFSATEIRDGASEAIEVLFESRHDLRKELSKLYGEQKIQPECARVARKVIRNLRGVEDYVGSVASLYRVQAVPVNPLAPDLLPRATLVNEDLKEPVRLQSGDILLSRGNANVSALIARMADEDTQFSHMAMVYVEPETHETFTIEAHIEVGAKIFPIGEWLKDGKVRTVIFRQKDPIRGAVAARYLYERVKNAQDAGRPVRYDFPFDMNDHRDLFCSEVVRQGYEFASAGTFLVPAFPSSFSMKNRDLLERLGITVQESFLPEDIEMDPRFDLIAEWRDFSKIGDAIRKDAIMDAIYHWMEEGGYRFHPAAKHRLKARVGKLLRNLGFMKKKMPTYMKVRAIEMSLMIEELMTELEEMIQDSAKRYQEETGLPYSFFQFAQELERLRKKEALKYGSFRGWFHP